MLGLQAVVLPEGENGRFWPSHATLSRFPTLERLVDVILRGRELLDSSVYGLELYKKRQNWAPDELEREENVGGAPRQPGGGLRKYVEALRKYVDLPRKYVDVLRKFMDLPQKYVEVVRQSVEVPRKFVEVVRQSMEVLRKFVQVSRKSAEIMRQSQGGRDYPQL